MSTRTLGLGALETVLIHCGGYEQDCTIQITLHPEHQGEKRWRISGGVTSQGETLDAAICGALRALAKRYREEAREIREGIRDAEEKDHTAKALEEASQ